MSPGTASGGHVVEALVAQQEELRALVAGRDDEALRRPTRCEGWSAADVLLHLAQTNEAAVASVAGRLEDFRLGGVGGEGAADVDELADLAVAAERSAAPTAVRDRWWASAVAQADAFRGGDPSAQALCVSGELAARSLPSTRLSETWIH
ncbi:MAG TPA: maleylpyruvate isomerase N-terminal domain-containing protein, partial [Acidimicrobiales bacterium]|nr:maleylpyruvate isomerase N-terminal domain-containing protein [Acidimicrobiales bacterium]